jgi:hypothetical protein
MMLFKQINASYCSSAMRLLGSKNQQDAVYFVQEPYFNVGGKAKSKIIPVLNFTAKDLTTVIVEGDGISPVLFASI